MAEEGETRSIAIHRELDIFRVSELFQCTISQHCRGAPLPRAVKNLAGGQAVAVAVSPFAFAPPPEPNQPCNRSEQPFRATVPRFVPRTLVPRDCFFSPRTTFFCFLVSCRVVSCRVIPFYRNFYCRSCRSCIYGSDTFIMPVAAIRSAGI